MKWKTETRKGGAEIYVECENRSIFVGEGYSMLEYGESMVLASVIEKALKENKYLLESQPVESTVTINPYNFSIIKQTFSADENLFEVVYDDYIEIENQNIPTKIKFLNNGVLDFNIEIKSISALEKINIPFRIPKNYKSIELE